MFLLKLTGIQILFISTYRFFEAYSNANLYLCGDLVRLFALCPMTGQRLKSDPKGNQAPRIMNQLSTDNRIEAEIRHLSTQVFIKLDIIIVKILNNSLIKKTNDIMYMNGLSTWTYFLAKYIFSDKMCN